MVESRRQQLTETEQETLKALWDHGPGTVRQIRALLERRGRRWAHTTVITLLQRLEAKGYVAVDKSGFAHVFCAIVSRDQLVQQRLDDLADELYEGEKTPLLLALVDRERFTAAEIQEFRDLIERLAGGKKRRPQRKREEPRAGGGGD